MLNRIDKLAYLAPVAVPAFLQLAKSLHTARMERRTRTDFRVFETYRTPERQQMVLARGNSKAGAFQSPHQFGLAVDFVPYTDRWSWDEKHDYAFLKSEAERLGLTVPISWDRCHVEHPRWLLIRPMLGREGG